VPAKSIPRHHRKAAHHRRLAGQCQAVLVIERRPFDLDRGVGFWQHGIVDVLQLSLVNAVVFGDQDSLEHGDSPWW
jgi:hypothetical protein